MNKLILTSPLPPSVNNYLHYKVARNARGKLFVDSYPSDETKIYKGTFTNYVKKEVKKQNWIKPEKGKMVFVELVFYMDRKRKDSHNLIKVLMDVLTQAGVYQDDDIAIPIFKRVYIDANNPRIEIEVYESDWIGIFDSREEYELFIEENCNGCRNYRKGHCSTLKDALRNVINENMKNKRCLKRKV